MVHRRNIYLGSIKAFLERAGVLWIRDRWRWAGCDPLKGAFFEELVEGVVAEAEEPVRGELEEVAFALDVDLAELKAVVFGGEFAAAVEGIVGREGQGDMGEGDDAVGPFEAEDFGGVIGGEG